VDCLDLLNDITCTTFPDGLGFELTFHFNTPNPFFTNSTLTKRYEVPNLLTEDEPILKNVTGCTIQWKKNQCLTYKEVTRKQRKKGGPKQNSFVDTAVVPSSSSSSSSSLYQYTQHHDSCDHDHAMSHDSHLPRHQLSTKYNKNYYYYYYYFYYDCPIASKCREFMATWTLTSTGIAIVGIVADIFIWAAIIHCVMATRSSSSDDSSLRMTTTSRNHNILLVVTKFNDGNDDGNVDDDVKVLLLSSAHRHRCRC
jgi:hypothetical protein